jgi:MFS family permease
MTLAGWRQSPGWTLVVLTAISTCGFIDRIVMNVLIEPVKAEFQLSDTQIGLLAGPAFAVLNVTLGLWVARLAERGRRVTLIGIGTLLWSLATLGCGAASNFLQLACARMAVGVGEAVGLPATTSVISDHYPPERRATALSVLTLAAPLGAFLGSSIGAALAAAYGWRSAFLVAAAPGFILTLIVLLTVSEPTRGRHDPPAASNIIPSLGAILSRIWKRTQLRYMLCGATIATTTGFGVNVFLAAFLSRRHGFDVADAGIIAGLIASLPASLSVLGSGWISDRWGQRNSRSHALVPAIALLIAAPLYVGALWQESAGLAILLFAAAALFQYCYIAPTYGVFQNAMEPRARASAQAIQTVCTSLVGSGLGPLLVGSLSDRFSGIPLGPAGNLTLALSVVTAGYLVAALFYLCATSRQARSN